MGGVVRWKREIIDRIVSCGGPIIVGSESIIIVESTAIAKFVAMLEFGESMFIIWFWVILGG